MKFIKTDLEDHIEALKTLDVDKLEKYKNIVKGTLYNGGVIYCAGNGGSASDSAHLVGEIVGKFAIDRPGYPAVDLSANNTVITAIGNDFRFDEVFSRQLNSMACSNDLLIVFTTSGNSRNIVEAVKEADKIGMKTLIISGKKGGILGLNKDSLIVNSDSTPVIQVVHTFILHQLAYAVDEFYLETEVSI